jgi:ParB-like chromosome segregation protein Spo0J
MPKPLEKNGKGARSARAILERPLLSLSPAPHNPRIHSDEQIDAVARSIRRFGFLNPVLITAAGQIVAGHARVLAARRLGLESVPCLVLDHLKPEDVRAYVIADNQLALRSGWDEELLKVELSGLKALGYDVTLSGFASKELRELLIRSRRRLPKRFPSLGISGFWGIIGFCAETPRLTPTSAGSLRPGSRSSW